MVPNRGARDDGTQAQSSMSFCLRQQVAKRRAQRTGEHIGDPERQDRIGAVKIGQRGDRDECAEQDRPEPEAQLQCFRR